MCSSNQVTRTDLCSQEKYPLQIDGRASGTSGRETIDSEEK